MHTTNSQHTFIAVADDCAATSGQIPPYRGDNKTVANLEYEMISAHPYGHTSDDVKFAVYAQRKGLAEADLPEARAAFFSKGQPCFRASPLTKTYGWGVHHDGDSRIALVGCETEAYAAFVQDPAITTHKAMRSRRG